MPISTKDWTFSWLLEQSRRFKAVRRVSASIPLDALTEAIQQFEKDGIPLVIEGWNDHIEWPKHLFNYEWLLRNHGDDIFSVRDVGTYEDYQLTMKDFLKKCRATLPDEHLYGKDAECPLDWKQWLEGNQLLPRDLLPGNAQDYLQHAENVEHLMCYFGTGDTFTPSHKDLCASTGQNIMCYTEHGGSSFWFMTASSDAQAATDYFHDHLHCELDWDFRLLTVEEFAAAPFDIYIVEQKLGDFVLVPPRSCHQVVNHGGLTIKMSWSRMTITGLEQALHFELPLYHRVCRRESYKIKATVYKALVHHYHTLRTQFESLQHTCNTTPDNLTTSRMPSRAALHGKAIIVETLLSLYDEILFTEYDQDFKTSHSNSNDSRAEQDSDQYSYSCDFCGADIFQSYFECTRCISNIGVDADRLLICSGCYVEGRTCRCQSMFPAQIRPFKELWDMRQEVVDLLLQGTRTGAWPEGHYRVSSNERAFIQWFVERGDIPTFASACMLRETRRLLSIRVSGGRQSDRGCKMGYEEARKSHRVALSDSINCKLCHASRCFTHLLEICVHSSQAIWLAESDKAHSQLHLLHKSRSKDHPDFLHRLMTKKETGFIPLVIDRFILYARRYQRFQACNSEDTRPGWYDKVSRHAIDPHWGLLNEDSTQIEVVCRVGSTDATSPPSGSGFTSPLTETGDDDTWQPPHRKLGPRPRKEQRAPTKGQTAARAPTVQHDKQAYVSIPDSISTIGAGCSNNSGVNRQVLSPSFHAQQFPATKHSAVGSRSLENATSSQVGNSHTSHYIVTPADDQIRQMARSPRIVSKKRKGPPGLSHEEFHGMTLKHRTPSGRSRMSSSSGTVSQSAKRRKTDCDLPSRPSSAVPEAGHLSAGTPSETHSEENERFKKVLAALTSEVAALRATCATSDKNMAVMAQDQQRLAIVQQKMVQQLRILREDSTISREVHQDVKEQRDQLRTDNEKLQQEKIALLTKISGLESRLEQYVSKSTSEVQKLLEEVVKKVSMITHEGSQARSSEAQHLRGQGQVHQSTVVRSNGQHESPLPSASENGSQSLWSTTPAATETNRDPVALPASSLEEGEQPESHSQTSYIPCLNSHSSASQQVLVSRSPHPVDVVIKPGVQQLARTRQAAAVSRSPESDARSSNSSRTVEDRSQHLARLVWAPPQSHESNKPGEDGPISPQDMIHGQLNGHRPSQSRHDHLRPIPYERGAASGRGTGPVNYARFGEFPPSSLNHSARANGYNLSVHQQSYYPESNNGGNYMARGRGSPHHRQYHRGSRAPTHSPYRIHGAENTSRYNMNQR